PSLARNPSLWTQDDDDDVDALDVEWKAGFGRNWTFSVDDEAHPNLAFDPGAIYQWDGVNLRLLVDENVHLGLPESTDIDAFEFVWLTDWQANGPVEVLGLVFSVDEDNPATLQDESGGLHPGRLYASMLTGSSFPLVQEIIGDDIDAIGAWWDTFFPRTCVVDLNGDTVLDIFDILEYLSRFSNGDPTADWNGDGVIDIFDVLAYLGDFSAGCP
ncbi:MAG: hypothetical protein KDA28_09675, partial [Phycisphaerales bacterium]|nr:hypothetical protein [Phycisphaerales bacterium]